MRRTNCILYQSNTQYR